MDGDLVTWVATVLPVDYQTAQDPFDSHGMSAVPPPKRRQPRLLLATLAALALAAGIATLAVVVPKLDSSRAQPVGNASSSDGKPAEVQIQCANIKHAYTLWSKGRHDLETLPHLPADTANFEAKLLMDEGKKFLDAVSGHADQSSKELATTVAGYNVEIGFVRLGLQLAGTFDAEAYGKAKTSWQGVESAYESFLVLTCA
jgi:hypothetical protein